MLTGDLLISGADPSGTLITSKITRANFMGGTNVAQVVGTTETQTLTNKDISSATNTMPTSLVTLTGTQVLTNKDLSSATNTLPTSVVTLTGSQVLTNKTLTAPVISTISNTGTLTLPTSTDTLVGLATADTLTNKTLTSPKFTSLLLDSAGNNSLQLTATASAVNYVNLINGATGTGPQIVPAGTDANIDLLLNSKNSGRVKIQSLLGFAGSSATIYDESFGKPILLFNPHANAVNYLQIDNAITSNGPIVSSAGTDANIVLILQSKGTSPIYLYDGASHSIAQFLQGSVSAVNFVAITNSATGVAPTISSNGTDPNIDLSLTGTGTGKVKSDTLYGAVTTDADGATVTFNCATTNRHEVVLGGNRTLALSNYSSGQMIVLDIIQDGTGSRTVTWFNGPNHTTTITIATPAVLTTGVNIPSGTPIVLSTTGALPTGLAAGTTYWYNNVSSTTGNLSTSLANLQAGTYIATSGSQSGVHTLNTQIRWFPTQTTPTLSTGKYVYDTFNIYVKNATVGVFQGYVAGQGG